MAKRQLHGVRRRRLRVYRLFVIPTTSSILDDSGFDHAPYEAADVTNTAISPQLLICLAAKWPVCIDVRPWCLKQRLNRTRTSDHFTRNSSADKIGERYGVKFQLPPGPRRGCKTLTP